MALWAIYWDHQTKRLQYEERRLMIEKGMTPPAVAPDGKWTIEDHLRHGTIMTFLGIGLGIAHVFVAGSRLRGPDWLLPIAASIVGLLGLGNLAYYLMTKNRMPEESAR